MEVSSSGAVTSRAAAGTPPRLDVRLPDHDPYRATRQIALELSTAPHVKVGAEVPVRVDPHDYSNVLAIVTL
jgi:hypothetical protein